MLFEKARTMTVAAQDRYLIHKPTAIPCGSRLAGDEAGAGSTA